MNHKKIYLLISAVIFSQMINSQDEEITEAIRILPNFENGMRIYRKCVACHNSTGGGKSGNYPQIAGQHIKVIIKELSNIRHRERENIMMEPFSQHRVLGGANNIADVAGYISRLAICPDNEIGPGNDLHHGAQLYNLHCAQCHGVTGAGSNADFYPRIHGQHFSYLLRQLQSFVLDQRHNGDPIMIKKISQFTERDQKAVADYVSRLRPPIELLSPTNCYN